ncbi:MAG: DegT/DnrJ/EryC1/StrS family aminotransferase [Candidatus Marinimicrobia bacterium]|nr:DegT/DnrJ/EryC1/StrS family aminotransferase [Candidatus Neomarinimicrobiota bacterium]
MRPRRDDFLVFGAPAIEEDEINEVVDSLRTGWLGSGPKVEAFENDFGSYKGVTNAVAVNSCTAALHLSLVAADLEPESEVITTAMTFCASVNAIIHANLTPVLVDVDPVTMNLMADAVEAAVTPKTGAILLVHFAGRSCNMDEIMAVAQKHGLKVIEDCAHAIETEYRGQKAGTFGDFGCFSFYVTKNVITGEGGMVIAAKQQDAAMIKMLALHGMTKDAWKRFGDSGYVHYFVKYAGFKYNMMDIQAAIGIHQLRRVEENWKRREVIWHRYNEGFANLPIGIPAPVEADTRHAYHLYTIFVDEDSAGASRDDFMQKMKELNIGVGVHYLSIPAHPYYQETFGWKPEDYPHAHQIGEQTVSLPLSPALSEGDVDSVIDAVKRILNS